MEDSERRTIELGEMNIILRIPEGAAALDVTATILGEDGETLKVNRRLSVRDIFKARQAFLDNVEDGDDYDGYYVLTEEALSGLKEGGDHNP